MGIVRLCEKQEVEIEEFRRMLLSYAGGVQTRKHQVEFSDQPVTAALGGNDGVAEEKLVCVTSGVSFLGLAIVNRLLIRGYSVRIVVTNEEDMEKLREMELSGEMIGANNRVIAVMADLTDVHNLSQAFDGCRGVFHTAAFVDPAGLSGYSAIQKNQVTHRRIMELRRNTREAMAEAEAKTAELEEARKELAELRSENNRLTELANSVEAEKKKVAAEAKDKYLRLLAKIEKQKGAEINQLKEGIKKAEKQGFKEAENAYTLQCNAAKDLFFKCGWRSAVEKLGCGAETEVYNAPPYSIPASLSQYAADLQKQFLEGQGSDEDDDEDSDEDEQTLTPAVNEQPNNQTVRLEPVIEDLTGELLVDNTQPTETEVQAETELPDQTALPADTGLLTNDDAEFDAELDALLR